MKINEGKSNFFQRIFSIARNTFREAVRDRVLYNLVLFVLLITAAAIFLGELTAGQEARTIVNLGLGAMLIFGAFISIFVGVSLVSKEIEKKTVYAIFSKPVSRAEFIIGKYLGLCATLFVNVVIMAAGVSLALVYVGGSDLVIPVGKAALLLYLELMILTAVATMFSSFSSPALSALLSFFVFLIGHFSASLNDLAKNLGSAGAQYFFYAIYVILPNLSNFVFRTETANHIAMPAGLFFGAAAYAVVYVAIVLTITIVIFSRRNFK